MEETKKTKTIKKIQYAIRMLEWHTMLAKRYHDIVKNWLDINNLDYSTNLMDYIEKKRIKKNENQLTIFDFL